MEIYPKISFLSPVLNEQINLPTYLQSILQQDYPKDKIEIIIADGGSVDGTIEIARKFNCIILDNPNHCAESGLLLCEKKASGDILFILAADNKLPCKDWAKKMVKPFVEDEKICGALTHIIPAENDSLFNRYYSLLHVEPFTWFVYEMAANPRYFSRVYELDYQKQGFLVYKFTTMNHPLVAFAQGFGVRRKAFDRKKENIGDDILPFIQMIEDGGKIAYVPEAGIEHKHLNSFKHFLKKYQWRIRNSLYKNNVGFENRKKYINSRRTARKYLWIFYGCTFIFPALDAIKWSLRDRELCWLWHAPASISLSYLILFEVMRKKITGVY
jgi:glycosyltransferase involved in cell wall biosynthesis